MDQGSKAYAKSTTSTPSLRLRSLAELAAHLLKVRALLSASARRENDERVNPRPSLQTSNHLLPSNEPSSCNKCSGGIGGGGIIGGEGPSAAVSLRKRRVKLMS